MVAEAELTIKDEAAEDSSADAIEAVARVEAVDRARSRLILELASIAKVSAAAEDSAAEEACDAVVITAVATLWLILTSTLLAAEECATDCAGVELVVGACAATLKATQQPKRKLNVERNAVKQDIDFIRTIDCIESASRRFKTAQKTNLSESTHPCAI